MQQYRKGINYQRCNETGAKQSSPILHDCINVIACSRFTNTIATTAWLSSPLPSNI